MKEKKEICAACEQNLHAKCSAKIVPKGLSSPCPCICNQKTEE